MKTSFKSYRDLDVWKRSMLLAKNLYQATAGFPAEERFGLTNQMRRAAVSIPSNIAEGHARSSTAQFQYFISIAMGSIVELETQLLLSADLGFCDNQTKDKLLEQLDEVGRMLRGLNKSLSSRAKD